VGPAVVAAIFAADVGLVLGVSILTAVLASITGLAFAGLVRGIAEPVATADPQADPSATDPAPPPSPGSLPWAVALPILLLFAGTLGRFPREPLGSGELHHALTALGGPIALLLAALTLALTLPGRRRPGPLPAPSGLVLSVRRCAPLMLTVAAAGGFARILQQPGLGDFLGDGLTGEGFVFPAMGVLLPFAIAAAIKTVQGSSLVAAITAAGIVEPLFPQLGIVDDPEKALAVVAVGAGAMVVSHANDTFFWVVGGAVGLSPAAGYRILTLATLATGTAAILTLLVLQWVTGSA
jgi:GntP family gluconate:H+ symporter